MTQKPLRSKVLLIKSSHWASLWNRIWDLRWFGHVGQFWVYDCFVSFITIKQNKMDKSDAPHRTCIHWLCYVHGYPHMPKLFFANKLKIMLKLQSLSKYCAKSGFFVVCFGFMLFLMGFIWTTHSSRVTNSKRRSDFFQKRKYIPRSMIKVTQVKKRLICNV